MKKLKKRQENNGFHLNNEHVKDLSDIMEIYQTEYWPLNSGKLIRYVYKQSSVSKSPTFKLSPKSDYICETWRKYYINVIPELQKETDFNIKDEKNIFSLGGAVFCPHSLHLSNSQLLHKFSETFNNYFNQYYPYPPDFNLTWTLEDLADNCNCSLSLLQSPSTIYFSHYIPQSLISSFHKQYPKSNKSSKTT